MEELKLKGSFYEMGLSYGRACEKQIAKFAKGAYIMASLSKKPGSQPFNPNLWHLIPTLLTYKREQKRWQELAYGYEKFIVEHHPDAIDFMKGIADGSEVPYIDILSLNIATENIITCSVWGAAGVSTRDNETFIGMNADEETATQNFEIFLDIQPDKGNRYKVTGLAGWVGYNHGMNEHGLGTVFYVADQKNLMRIECTPEKRNYELIDTGIFGNTNMIESEKLRAFDGTSLLRQNLNALQRQIRMKELLKKNNGGIDKQIMEAIASDHGVPDTETHEKSLCQHPKGIRYNFKTLVSFIAQPRERQFWIYEGNPCEKQVKQYDFID